MGLLDDVAEAVTRRGQDIMDLIRSGRADEVTREMLDMGDPVMNARLNEYLWNNYDLPMDKASRMERAQGAGFIDPAYRGTLADERNTKPQQFVSQDPAVANSYAGNIAFADEIGLPPHLAQAEGGNVMPLLVDKRENSSIVPESYEYKLPSTAIRSAFARFDPRLRHLDNLNAGVAGATAAGAGLLGYGDEANAMPAPEAASGGPSEGGYSLGYRDTLGQLYQTNGGGVMYPKGQSAEGLLATVDQPAPEAPQPELSAFDEALRYYLGPTGIPERIGAANELFNPVRGLERGMVASSQALDPNSGLTGWERVGKGMDATTETLGALLGFGGAKTAIEGAAPLIDDALTAGARFGMEEAGSVPIPRIFGIGDNGGPPLRMPYTRVGSDIAENLRGHVSAAEIARGEPTIFGSGMTNIKSAKPTALSGHTSRGLLDEELIPPQQIKMADVGGRTLLGIVGDNSGRHTVTHMGDTAFETPINTQGGFQYIDRAGQGYAGAKGPTAGKLREAAATEDPMYISLMMGEQSPDFAVPTSQIFGQMLRGAPIAKKDAPAINEAIRNIGMSVKSEKLVDGKLVKYSETVYPFRHFKDITKQGYFDQFVASLPSGSQRAAFLKGLDKANLHKLGLPKVSDARAAMADEAQLGMDWGSTGYRAMVPDIERGAHPTTPDMSLTYDTGVDKVGPSYSFTGEGKGVPYSLVFPDLASELRANGTGGGLEMTSPTYKVFEGSHKRAKQLVDDRVIEMVDTFREMEDRFGRRTAMQYAADILKEVDITPSLLAAAKKANAPQWMLAAMAPTGLLAMGADDQTRGAQ